MTIILTILAFGLMIFVHELGHFLIARACKVGIESFSIGFGNPILKYEKNGISYRIGWIPLGGYVKMKGENPDEQGSDDPLSFRGKAWWKKALIAVGGPFANLLLGLLLFVISFLLPLNMEDQRPVIQKAEGKWAQVFATGDSLISFNGKAIKGYSDWLETLLTDKQGSIVLSRSGKLITIPISSKDVDSLAVSLYPKVSTRIGEVLPKTPAYHADLKVGDIITRVDSVAVLDWYAMREVITKSPRDSVLLDIRRGNQIFTKSMHLESSIATGNAKTIGIMQYQPVHYQRFFSVPDALKLGAVNTVNFLSLNYQMLFKLAGKPSELKKSVGGPVMIASMSQQMGQKGFSQLLLFFAAISLMLMIMNLLPIPILDGGLILFAVIEGIIRKPIPLRIQSILQSIGFVLLVFIMVYAFYADISSLILRYIAR